MDIRQLRYFLAIVEEGQITRAAKMLNMEQPPLSRQLQLMERELGVALFNRLGKSLQLTEAGELLRQRAADLVGQFDETLTRVKELDAGTAGVLSVGAVVSCTSLLPPAIVRLRRLYPGLVFKLREGDHHHLAGQLETREIELVVTRLPFESAFRSDHYTVMPLPSDPFVAFVPEEWTALRNRTEVALRELAETPLLSLKTDRTTRMHEAVLQQFARNGLKPRFVCECASVALVLTLVASGIGAAILPRSALSAATIPSVRRLDIPDLELESETGVVWLKNRRLSGRARRFADILLDT